MKCGFVNMFIWWAHHKDGWNPCKCCMQNRGKYAENFKNLWPATVLIDMWSVLPYFGRSLFIIIRHGLLRQSDGSWFRVWMLSIPDLEVGSIISACNPAVQAVTWLDIGSMKDLVYAHIFWNNSWCNAIFWTLEVNERTKMEISRRKVH